MTAGPTREHIDPVRFISNASSGKMGYAIATEAARKGHEVILVSGPVCLSKPLNIDVVDVVSAKDMSDACHTFLDEGVDVFICAAAIADFTPIKKTTGKISSGDSHVISLKPGIKLVDEVSRRYPQVFTVGFKAEHHVSSDTLVERALGKLTGFGLDLIVGNDIGEHAFGSDSTEVVILSSGGVCRRVAGKKAEVARELLEEVESRLELPRRSV